MSVSVQEKGKGQRERQVKQTVRDRRERAQRPAQYSLEL